MASKSSLLIFLLIWAATLFLFIPSLNYYFFQDDWFVLNWARNESFLSLFNFKGDVIYWRPLTMPIFFKLGQVFFNSNPFYLHTITFLFHFANIILIYFLFKTLKFSKQTSLLIAFMYGTASFHFVPLSWLSTTSYIVGPTFIILSLILFLKKRHFLSFAIFALGLASSELVLTTIPIIFLLNTDFQKKVKYILPYLAVGATYLMLRFVVFPLPVSGDYEISINGAVMSNLLWYFLWAFNVPEKFYTLIFFTHPNTLISSLIMFPHLLIGPIILITFYIVLTFFSKPGLKVVLKSLCLFTLGLLPILFIPKHAYSMYLAPASLGIFYLLAHDLDRITKYRTLTVITIAFLWFTSSLQAIFFTRTNHWLVNEQTISKAYVKEIMSTVHSPPDGSLFILKPADIRFAKENKFVLIETEENVRQALNDQDAVQYIFKNSTLKSLYLPHQSNLGIPQSTHVFEISPRGAN